MRRFICGILKTFWRKGFLRTCDVRVLKAKLEKKSIEVKGCLNVFTIQYKYVYKLL